jgi:RecQ family ATP-dependent DNA helicase
MSENVVIRKKKVIKLKKERTDRLVTVLKDTFGHQDFRPKQKQIISNVLDGNDLLVLLPTGSGKSLCYQLPAVISDGVSIVISPLIALINDQMLYLENLGISCYYFNSQTKTAEKRALLKDLNSDNPQCKLFYTTPETIVSNLSLRMALERLHKKKLLARVVIDEAHCVSNWGHEFRPSYLKLRQLKKIYPGIQIVSFTATATPMVQIDIIKQLSMKRTLIHKQSFVRKNLSYQVRPKTVSVVPDMARLIKSDYTDESGIIYCLSRQNCEDVSEQLCALGLNSHHFHAGMSGNDRKDIQEKWLNDEIQIIVATIAFGLGINKPDVRFVFHYSLPKSIEGYYQETGRAGRDGQPSDCILFYSARDKRMLEYIIKKEEDDSPTDNLELIEMMSNFCRNQLDCRKKLMSIYLGEYAEFNCNMQDTSKPYGVCDNCAHKEQVKTIDLNDHLSGIKTLFEQRAKYNYNNLIDQLIGMTGLSKNNVKRWIDQMVIDGVLDLKTALTKNREIVQYYQLAKLNNETPPNLSLVVKDQVTMADFCRKSSDTDTNAGASTRLSLDDEDDGDLNSKLSDFRVRIAGQNGWPLYRVFSNRTLEELVDQRPSTEQEMLNIYGIGAKKLESYGQELLQIINS